MQLFNNINFSRLKEGLSKTRDKLVTRITETFSGKAVIDDDTLNELEEILISSDLNSELAVKIINNLRVQLKDEKDRSQENIINLLKNELLKLLEVSKSNSLDKDESKKPYVILIVGVNGVGKTTTIGKLANNYKKAGNRVIVGAADTFRVAANEQLAIWAKRANVEIIQHKQGSDPSSVAFDTVKKGIEGNYDVVLIDTAGRLHSKVNLMNELNKITKAINKQLPNAPNDTYLVLDATIGQNSVLQTNEFSRVTKLTGLVVTKLDGTAKGGVIINLSANQGIPVKYVGVGESIDDLQIFNPKAFVDAIFNSN
jgi:fused signal recognition particle receptor